MPHPLERFNKILALVGAGLILGLVSVASWVSLRGGPSAPGEKAPLRPEEAAPEALRHREAFRALAARARAAVPACRERSTHGGEPGVRGKALIWDDARNDLSAAHFRLPADVRAPDADGPVTVFLTTRQERKSVTAYPCRAGS